MLAAISGYPVRLPDDAKVTILTRGLVGPVRHLLVILRVGHLPQPPPFQREGHWSSSVPYAPIDGFILFRKPFRTICMAPGGAFGGVADKALASVAATDG